MADDTPNNLAIFDLVRQFLTPERHAQAMDDWRSYALSYARQGLMPPSVANCADLLLLEMLQREERLRSPLATEAELAAQLAALAAETPTPSAAATDGDAVAPTVAPAPAPAPATPTLTVVSPTPTVQQPQSEVKIYPPGVIPGDQ